MAEARATHAAGADAAIIQGVEAGGHVRGNTPAMELLDRVRAALPDDFPLFVAGGIAERADVQRVLAAGATAAVAGTRSLPDAMQQRLARAQRPGKRLLSPIGPTDDGPATLLDAGPLYAGEPWGASARFGRRRGSSAT